MSPVSGRLRPIFRLVVTAVLLLLLAPAHAHAATGAIAGSIVDEAGALVTVPIEVSAGNRVAVTTTDGRYRFDDLEPGSQLVRLRFPGAEYVDVYHPGVQQVWEATGVEVRAGETTTIQTSVKRAGTLTGRMTGEDGTPLAGVRFYFFHSPFSTSAVTDADGRYRIEGLPRERMSMRVIPPAPLPETDVQVDMSDGGAHTLDLVLRAAGIIRGRVLDPAGMPLPNAPVTIHGNYGNVLGPQPTRADGSFEFRGVPDGAWYATIPAPEDAPMLDHRSDHVLLRVGGLVEGWDIQVPPAGWLAGRFVDEAARPLPGAWAAVRRQFATMETWSAQAGGDGRFRVKLPIGGWLLFGARDRQLLDPSAFLSFTARAEEVIEVGDQYLADREAKPPVVQPPPIVWGRKRTLVVRRGRVALPVTCAVICAIRLRHGGAGHRILGRTTGKVGARSTALRLNRRGRRATRRRTSVVVEVRPAGGTQQARRMRVRPARG